MAYEAGAEDAIRADAFEAIVRAGLEERFTPSGVAGLTAEERSLLRDAMAVEFEVPIEQAAVDAAIACIAWHWAGEDESEDAAAQEPPAGAASVHEDRYRRLVGLLNEFFLAADDDEARQAVRHGAVAEGWVQPIIEASGWTHLEIELLEEAITGRPWSPGELDVLTEDDDDPEGPFVVRFPEGVIDALLELSSSEVLAAAERWASFEELHGSDADVLASVLEDFIHLVATGASSGKKPYLWVCL